MAARVCRLQVHSTPTHTELTRKSSIVFMFIFIFDFMLVRLFHIPVRILLQKPKGSSFSFFTEVYRNFDNKPLSRNGKDRTGLVFSKCHNCQLMTCHTILTPAALLSTLVD